jgi:hypothetical protein
MNPVERDLRESLRRRQAPSGFADRVLARTRESESRRPLWSWLAVAALIVLMIGGGAALISEQRRQAEGERAKQQLMAGLRITGMKLSEVQLRLARIQQRAAQPRSEQ